VDGGGPEVIKFGKKKNRSDQEEGDRRFWCGS